VTRTWIRSYVLPLLLTGAAAAVIAGLRTVGAQEGLFLFVPAVMLSAWFGGLTGGIVATMAAVVSTDLSLFEPRGSLSIESLSDVLLLTLFGAVCASISVLTAGRRQAEAQREQALGAAEQARHDAEISSRLKDQFLATLSHELRTPLNAVLGWTRMLAQGQVEPDKVPTALASIERNANAQKQLVDDLLDVSAIVSGRLRLQPREIDLAEVVQGAVDSVRLSLDARHHRLEQQIDPVRIIGDADRLRQVMWNLLSNAVKFTPDGGEVMVRVEHLGHAARISVRDSGRGIGPEFLPHVFEPFRQADSSITRTSGGLGLGLALVRHLVEAHGGSVSVWSAGARQGTTFVVTLPVQGIKGDSFLPPLDIAAAARARESAMAHAQANAVVSDPSEANTGAAASSGSGKASAPAPAATHRPAAKASSLS
jgi:signal transduction histidine kinase